MDQIAELEWIERNIAAFGADPKCVTIGPLPATFQWRDSGDRGFSANALIKIDHLAAE